MILPNFYCPQFFIVHLQDLATLQNRCIMLDFALADFFLSTRFPPWLLLCKYLNFLKNCTYQLFPVGWRYGEPVIKWWVINYGLITWSLMFLSDDDDVVGRQWKGWGSPKPSTSSCLFLQYYNLMINIDCSVLSIFNRSLSMRSQKVGWRIGLRQWRILGMMKYKVGICLLEFIIILNQNY